MIASDGLPDELPHQVRSTETLRSERAALSEGGRVAAEGSAVYLYALAPQMAPEMAPEMASRGSAIECLSVPMCLPDELPHQVHHVALIAIDCR